MSFKLSDRSLSRLRGVHPDLVAVVKGAIELTDVDFGVGCGLRDEKQQRALVASGASKTLRSKHLQQADGFGHAVALFAYVRGSVSWSLPLYDNLADAMKVSARARGIQILWGAAWTIPNISDWDGTMEEAMNSYIDTRRSEGKRPFIDGPHYQLAYS